MDPQTGQFLYLVALAHCKPDAYFQDVFNTFSPPGSDKTWFRDQRARNKVILTASLWVNRQVELNEEAQSGRKKLAPTPSLASTEMPEQHQLRYRSRWKKDPASNDGVEQ
jgi:hypothetical protein